VLLFGGSLTDEYNEEYSAAIIVKNSRRVHCLDFFIPSEKMSAVYGAMRKSIGLNEI
jgi:hypothetical protein